VRIPLTIILGPGSDADGGGIVEDGGHTHPGCSVAIGTQCFLANLEVW
jgi:hypothetical protein